MVVPMNTKSQHGPHDVITLILGNPQDGTHNFRKRPCKFRGYRDVEGF